MLSISRSLSIGLAFLLAPSAAVYAQSGPDGVEATNEAVEIRSLAGPILYSGNKSYFLLVEDFSTGHHEGVEWGEARAHAAKRRFRGRRGRLAVIDSADLYQWILTTFNLGQYFHEGRTWIGLRYWCKYRQLALASGEAYPVNGFTAWDQPWERPGGTTCSSYAKLPFMGVYIEGATGRWRATGHRKRFPYYLVEFPAPQKADSDDAADSRD